ncbi:jg4901 [Pararge aegeria aegeria]|uniref:Jg4901 protein n=1 Tax=Pararge aegeria aegeria TaxID=348720 RepID=A0A8S4R0I5_9NEOP|nr:jg4901 [Pararge aegeria aegeria]
MNGNGLIVSWSITVPRRPCPSNALTRSVVAGFLIDFISGPVSVGFTSAAAIIIATTQVKDILGLSFPGGKFLQVTHSYLANGGYPPYPPSKKSTWKGDLARRLRACCSKKTLLRRIPILGWLPNYSFRSGLADIIAGASIQHHQSLPYFYILKQAISSEMIKCGSIFDLLHSIFDFRVKI